jgi:hypothetical protein
MLPACLSRCALWPLQPFVFTHVHKHKTNDEFEFIKAAADKIIREIELFGPDFEGYTADPEVPAAKPTAGEAPGAAVDKGKKGKLAAKSTGHVYQFQIMEAMGVPRAEIKEFADPQKWLDYFPPIAKVGAPFPTSFICPF